MLSASENYPSRTELGFTFSGCRGRTSDHPNCTQSFNRMVSVKREADVGAGVGRPQEAGPAAASSLLWPWASHGLSPPSLRLMTTFNFEILWLPFVLNWGLFPEGIYNLADDRRPTIISQLENQTSAEWPFTEENLKWPLKKKSDLQRWGAGEHSSLMPAWDFWLRLTSQTLRGFF